MGAGRTELARTIFGLTRADSGEILLRGKAISITNPADAISRGVVYVPEDRRRHGVIGDLPIDSNITLGSLGPWGCFTEHDGSDAGSKDGDRSDFQRERTTLARWWTFDFRRERAIAADYVARMRIKTPTLFSPVSTLSGGNQQKVALSRWLALRPAALILDEPTQGIDVGAKSEIHELMMELAEQGAAILMISSELPEILGMSDRVAVMRGGTICATLNREEATQQRVLALALGHDQS